MSAFMQASSALELSHEANIAYRSALSAVHDLINLSLTDVTVLCGDPRAFAKRTRDHSLAVQVAFEAFVGAIAADTRKRSAGTITFPWALPQQPQQASLMLQQQPTSVAQNHSPAAGGSVSNMSMPSASPRLPMLPSSSVPSPRQPVVFTPAMPPQALLPTTEGHHGSSSSTINNAAFASTSNINTTLSATDMPLIGGKYPPLKTTISSSIAIGFDSLARMTKADEGVLLIIERKGGDEHPNPSAATSSALPSAVTLSSASGSISTAVGYNSIGNLYSSALAPTSSASLVAQAICLFGSQRSPSSVRLPVEQGPIGSVLRTGIALNISPENPAADYGHMLCFPIFKSKESIEPIGAVVLERKGVSSSSFGQSSTTSAALGSQGIAPFGAVDEGLVEGYCNLVAHQLCCYNQRLVDLQFDTYDFLKRNGAVHLAAAYKPLLQDESKNRTVKNPRLSKSLTGAGAASLPQMSDATIATKVKAALDSELGAKKGGGRGGDTLADLFLTASTKLGTSGDHAGKLAALLSAQPRLQLVLHSAHHSHFTKARIKPLQGTLTIASQNIVDVAAYISTVEDCWRRSADDVQALTVNQMAKADDSRNVRKQLKDVKDRNTRLERVANSYKDRYEDLRRELTTVCDAPLEDDGDDEGTVDTAPSTANPAHSRRY